MLLCRSRSLITNTLTTNRLTMYGLTINLSLIHINDNMGTPLKGSIQIPINATWIASDLPSHIILF